MLFHRFRSCLPECPAISATLLGAIVMLIVALAPLRGNAEDLSSPAGEKIRDVFIVPDALGSPAALLNEAGEVIWRQGYSPYGERLNNPHEPEVTGTVDYTGHQVDPSGLVYTGARYYDPQIGRFLSMDPAGFDPANVQSFNRYAYANNNPYRYVDPDGELPFLVPLLIFVGKEAAGEVFEQVTGIPAPTVKNFGKAAIKQGIKKSAKARPRSSTRPGGRKGGFYRGARAGNSPDFTPRANDFRVDKNTGFVKDTHGVSVFDNADSVRKKGFEPHRVDESTIPESLRIIQRGKDPHHFEIVPKPGANLTPQEFIGACSQIGCTK